MIIEEYDRLEKELSRMKEQKTFRNRSQRASLGQNKRVTYLI